MWGHSSKILLSFLLTLRCFTSYAQSDLIRVTGTTLDSATHLQLPFVAIKNKSTGQGTTSDENGLFIVSGSPGDTLQFSRVGYLPKDRLVPVTTSPLTVLLRENPQMLKAVTVYGNFQPHGSRLWKNATVAPKTFRNPAGPGSGYGVETFGPGIVIGGAISSLTKGAREKKKLKKEKEKNLSTETYRNTITSEETKDFFMKTFSLTEEGYSRKIEQFNARFPDAAFLTSKDEIVRMLVNFFAQKE